MKDPIEIKVNKWIQGGDNKYSEINLRINFLNKWLFYDYEPSLGPNPNFIKRLSSWLDNISDEDGQKLMFELVPNIFYVGKAELDVLYREAYHTVFAKWLIDQVKIDFISPTVLADLNAEIVNTWFCPFTDSLRINQFYHINNIPGKQNHRPDWRSLRTFGDVDLIKKYIYDNGIKRIVLLEDFIGNGGQISKTVEFVVDNLKEMSVLIIPLIICPVGMSNSVKFMETHKNITIVPVIAIPGNYFIHEAAGDIDDEMFKKIHELALKTYGQVSDSTQVSDDIDPYGPFGWRRTGGIVVMHTNTPNNTLPLIHNKSDTWQPLFKRHKRV